MKMCRMHARDVCEEAKKKRRKKNEYSRHACVITRNAKNRKSTTKCCDVASSMQGEMSIPGSCRPPS